MKYPVIDSHCDTVLNFLAEGNNYVFTNRNERGHVDLPRMREGRVKLQFFALYIEPEFKPEGALRRCLQLLDCYYNTVNRTGTDVQTILNAAELHSILDRPALSALISVEGGEALEGELAVLRLLFRLGVRALGLTWNQANQLGVGVGDDNYTGLTLFGREVVREMNKLGMIVDLAHINKAGFNEAVYLSNAPIIVSHANARALCNHPRNLTDEQLRTLRDHGGVVGLSVCPYFIHDKHPSLEILLDHFIHVAETAGIEHLGIGTDYDGIEKPLSGLDDVSCLPLLVEGLASRGFSAHELKMITSGNYLRVLKQVLPAG